MKFLELKIPPVLFFFVTATCMWSMTLISNELGINTNIRFIIGAVSLLAGGFIAISGIVGFRKAKTTVNPTKPDKASSLVCSGIYRYTRNPMYTGLLFVLIAWSCFLDNLFSLLFVFAYRPKNTHRIPFHRTRRFPWPVLIFYLLCHIPWSRL